MDIYKQLIHLQNESDFLDIEKQNGLIAHSAYLERIIENHDRRVALKMKSEKTNAAIINIKNEIERLSSLKLTKPRSYVVDSEIELIERGLIKFVSENLEGL